MLNKTKFPIFIYTIYYIFSSIRKRQAYEKNFDKNGVGTTTIKVNIIFNHGYYNEITQYRVFVTLIVINPQIVV